MIHRVIDLFAGAGGLSLGLHKAGLQGAFGIEKDAMAFSTLRSNLIGDEATYNAYPDWPSWLPKEPMGIEDLLDNQEITRKLRDLRGKVSLVAGGPPCQGFSVGGARNGHDERNELAFKMLDFVDIVQPRIVLIENVEGMTRRFVSRPGQKSETSVAEQVVERLRSSGYNTEFQVLDASDFGVPQTRRRIVIIGIQDDMKTSASEYFEVLQKIKRTEKEKLGLSPESRTSAEEALEDLNNPTTRQTSPEWPRFKTAAYKDAESAYGILMREGVETGEIPDSHRYSNHGSRVENLFIAAHAAQVPGRLSKKFLEENNCKSDKKVLIDRKKPVSTLTSHPDEFIHYSEPRAITVREMARLQSFPDTFKFSGRYTINGDRRGLDVARCVQVGNAVPPLFGYMLGRAALEVLNGK